MKVQIKRLIQKITIAMILYSCDCTSAAFSIHHYREGVVAQFFYVGAQIMCWTFIIQYGTRLFMSKVWRRKLPKYYHKNIISSRWLFSVSAVLSVPSSCATLIQVNYWPYLPLRVAASPPESSSSRISGVCTAW